MKTLKFMLAAATALGLASAYADPEAGASTTFESLTQGTNVVNGLKDTVDADGSYFYYAGDPADNESTIAAAGDMTGIARPRGATGSQNNILQVSTGTNALFRSFQSFTSGEPLATTFTSDVYVDTLVQFTVTPYTDKVTPGDGDKLMIYLKECTNAVGVVEGTNLVVVGKRCFDDGDFRPQEYKVQNVTVDPGVWYRLTVKAIADYGKEYIDDETDEYHHPAFSVYINGTICTFDELAAAGSEDTDSGFVEPFGNAAFGEGDLTEAKIVFSLMCTGSEPATLQAVGFAGEGKVDDLMITMADPFVDPVQFTLSYGEGISAVEYTIGSSKYYTSGTTSVYPGDTITIDSVTYADGYAAAANTATGLTGDGPYTVGNTACSLVLGATYATYTIAYELGGGTNDSRSAVSYTYSASAQTATVYAPGCEGSNFVNWTISPNAVTIDGTTLTIPAGTYGAITLTANWEAAQQSGWADDPTVIPDNTPAATQYPALADTALATADAKKLTVWAKANNVDFSTVKDDASDYVEAFLLNCATGDVADEKAEFVLSITFDSEGNPVVNLPDGKNYNGTLQMKGSPDLTNWTNVSEPSSTYKFYKYELSL